jgi:hypothetical protein
LQGRWWPSPWFQASAEAPARQPAIRALDWSWLAQCAAKLKGDETSEAQTFLFHLLTSFGQDANTLPEGSTFECRGRFLGERTKYADFLWPGRYLAISLKPRRDC